jgi:5''-nucleotidase/2'',3''-cyclic phosphodiesterase and related esterases
MLACKPKDTSFVFVETTDTHGGFDKMYDDAVLIKKWRDSLGNRLILLDGGDNLQGTTFMYCSNEDTTMENLAAKVFNYFLYDVLVVGNHDIEAGKKVFDRLYSQTTMPVVCANIIDEKSGEPYFKPYAVLDREGYKIAVLGLLTPYVTTWVPERLRPGLEFEQLEASAQKWMRIIKEKENPDLVVGLFHSGYDSPENNVAVDSLLGRENAVKWVAENVTGFDLIFYGHDHRSKADFVLNAENDTVWLLNSGNRGNAMAKAEVIMADGKLKTIKVEVVPTDGPHNDTAFVALLQPYLDRAEDYQQRDVVLLPDTISSNDALLGPSLWVDEIHRAQFDIVESQGFKADISFASPLSSNKMLVPGMLKVKDFFTWYPFENSLSVLSMTGRDIKNYIEFSYQMKTPIFNFDSGAGILYEVNDSKADGEKIRIISMANGTAFEMDSVYNVVMNSYRAMGGGGHLLKGVGWQVDEIADHVVWESDKDLRSLFIEWASKKGTLDSIPLNHWKIK